MSVLRVVGIFEPATAKAVAAFQGTLSALDDRFHPALLRAARISQVSAHLISVLLTPAAVLALVFGLWRLSADLSWTSHFPIAQGFFSHWLVWIALAIGLQSTASLLDRPDFDQPPNSENS